jgi:hypothetical protein
MNVKLLGTLLGVAMLAIAAPAGAATVTGTSIVNDAGTVTIGDPPLGFSATDLANGAQGVNGASFDHGKRYYDYVFSFTLSTAADVVAGATATAGTNVLESQFALFSGAPTGTDLDVGHNPGPLTSLIDTSGLLASASSGPGNGVLNTLTVANLAAGTYFLRIFGVIAGNSDINSHLVALNGTVAATPIPAALPLFATALGLFGCLGWRRKAGSAAA